MKINIQKSTVNDIDSIAEIYNRIHDYTEKGFLHTGWIRDIYPTRLEAMEAHTRGELFVEEMEGRIVGSAIINKVQLEIYKNAPWKYFANSDEVMVIHTLTIDPAIKRCGLGNKFMEFYEKYAIQNSCKFLKLDTNEKNIEARKFYNKLEFNEIAILPTPFHNIGTVNLVLLEKEL